MTNDDIRKLSDQERAAIRAAADLEAAVHYTKKIQNEADAALLAAEKTRQDMKADGSILRRCWTGITQIIQLLVGIGGLVGGYLVARVQYGDENAKLTKREEEVKKTEQVQKEFEKNKKLMEQEGDLAQREMKVAAGETKIAKAEHAEMDKALEAKKTQLAGREKELKGKLEKIEDANRVSDGLLKRINELEDKLVDVGKLVAQKKPQEAEKVAKAAVTPLPTSGIAADVLHTEVGKLFDTSAKIRGDAYDRLTSKQYRTESALPGVLIEVGREQLEKYQPLMTKPNDAEALSLRRGLENVIVTLRDISRSVTQIQGTKESIVAFAQEVSVLSYGAGQEAASLLKWINTHR